VRTIFISGLGLLIAACGQSDSSADAENGPQPVAEVHTAIATAGGAVETIKAYGVAEQGAGSENTLATQAEATLARIVAPTGTAVGAGQVVAILNPSATSRLDLGKATTDAKAANDALARVIRLRKDGLSSDADVTGARATARTAAQALAAARQRSATLVLRAPVAGTVQGLVAKQGDLIAAGTTVASIGTRGALRLHLGVAPAIAARVRAGQPLSISSVGSNASVASKVLGVDPQVDPATHLASIYANLPAGGFGPGQPLSATISLSGAAVGVAVPYSALLDDGGHTYVFVINGNIAKRRDVRPGNTTGDVVQILQGLQPGDRVVTQGGTALDDGMKVREQQPLAPRAGRIK
jgi:RND family efflux transporter MFP subunit